MRFIPLEKFDRFVAGLEDVYRRDYHLSHRRDALAVLLGLHGLRAGEVCDLRYSDVVWDFRLLKIRTLKGGRERTIQLSESVFSWFQDVNLLFPGDRETGCIFRSRTGKPLDTSQLNEFSHRCTKRLLGTPLRFHAMRHTFGMRAYEKTKDLVLVAKMMGHRSVSSTQIYVDAVKAFDPDLMIDLPSAKKHHVADTDRDQLLSVDQ